MKNSRTLEVYLNLCAELRQRWQEAKDDNALLQAYNERLPSALEESSSAYNAAIADGWTKAEINAAYERRFGK